MKIENKMVTSSAATGVERATGDQRFSTADVLEKAKALIEAPGRWTQIHMARTKNGHHISWRSESAYRFCMCGALNRTIEDGGYSPMLLDDCRLALVGPNASFSSFNDADERTHAEVLAAFDKAIAAAREGQRTPVAREPSDAEGLVNNSNSKQVSS